MTHTEISDVKKQLQGCTAAAAVSQTLQPASPSCCLSLGSLADASKLGFVIPTAPPGSQSNFPGPNQQPVQAQVWGCCSSCPLTDRAWGSGDAVHFYLIMMISAGSGAKFMLQSQPARSDCHCWQAGGEANWLTHVSARAHACTCDSTCLDSLLCVLSVVVCKLCRTEALGQETTPS